ncbi:hypothetical protein Rt10032_c09g3967 [Rhodotorula toruloides]|uniref:Uncharacterized protein n=1 Tax=Rhodotorula toruloides TaxID=5286 RepID=A0A511KHV3_RHOTO|nr:hypothetical protein Rt10032_c09g3967 [Rhodotorula toruloides]
MSASQDPSHTRRGFWVEVFRGYASSSALTSIRRLTKRAFLSRMHELSIKYKIGANGGTTRDNKFPWSSGEKDVFVDFLLESKHGEYDWEELADKMEAKLRSEGVEGIRRSKASLEGRLRCLRPYWMRRVYQSGGNLVTTFGEKLLEKQGGLFKEATDKAEEKKKTPAVSIHFQLEGVQAFRGQQGASTSNLDRLGRQEADCNEGQDLRAPEEGQLAKPRPALAPLSLFDNYTVQRTIGPEDIDELDDQDASFPQLEVKYHKSGINSLKKTLKQQEADGEELDELDDDYDLPTPASLAMTLKKDKAGGSETAVAHSSTKSPAPSTSSFRSTSSASQAVKKRGNDPTVDKPVYRKRRITPTSDEED